MSGRFCLPAAVAFLLFLGIFPALAQTVTINVTPSVVHIGDMVILNGTVSGIQTIAVYLFMTGPDLDSRGVTLENINIPAGHGLFTTAPVDMNNGTWQYSWDTSIILGNMNPGRYIVYVVTSPIDRERFSNGGYASADVTLLPPEAPATPVPLSPGITVAALGITSLAGACMIRRVKKR
ncbi:MAG: hypothetical protein ABSG28_05755 [Methanoregula sp.]|jgi:hypothetical protein|uniref:hypothetical protein n=1 Tax=Methanoregula sp. TaxID=2052170 RepID=UPI003C168821